MRIVRALYFEPPKDPAPFTVHWSQRALLAALAIVTVLLGLL